MSYDGRYLPRRFRARFVWGCAALAAGMIPALTTGASAISLPVLAPKPAPASTATGTSVPPPGATVRPPVGSLHVVGNQILDELNHPIVLGGVHRLGYEVATGDDMGDTEANSLATWASMVRIAVSAPLVASTCNNGGAAYLTRLDNVVAKLTSRNIVALIDYHSSSPSGCSSAKHLILPQKAEALSFWNIIAPRYAGNPLVAFEVYNEPHAKNSTEWRNGGLIIGQGLQGTYTAAGIQELYNIIVSKTTNNLIIVDTNHYSSYYPDVVSGVLTNQATTRTAWAMHVYTCPKNKDLVCINQSANRSFPTSPGTNPYNWQATTALRPVIITETGFPHPTGALPPPGGQWFDTAGQWAGDTSLHGGAKIGIIGFSDEGSWNGSDWMLLDSAHQWTPNSSGAPLATYMKSAQPAV